LRVLAPWVAVEEMLRKAFDGDCRGSLLIAQGDLVTDDVVPEEWELS